MADVNKKITFETNIRNLITQIKDATSVTQEYDKALKQLDEDYKKAVKNHKERKSIVAEKETTEKLLQIERERLRIFQASIGFQQFLLNLEKERLRTAEARQRMQQREMQDFWSGKNNPNQTLLQKVGERLSPSRNLGRFIDESRLKQNAALGRQSKFQDLADEYGRQAVTATGKEKAALLQLSAGAQTGADEAGAEAAKAGGAATAASAALTVVNTVSRMGKEFAKNFKLVFGFSLSIKDNFADILNNVRKMLDATSGMASYNTESSLFTNAAARTTRLQYGLSGSQAYGMTQAMTMLGMRNEEDLMYMNAKQRGAFINIMEKQAAWQAKMEASGVLESIQEFQLDFEMFKQEIAVQFLQWIAENKDELMAAARTVVKVLKVILTVIAKLLTLFSGESLSYGAGSTTLSDAIASGSVSTDNSRNLNLNQNYTINGAGDNPNNYLGAVQNWADMTAKQTSAAMG